MASVTMPESSSSSMTFNALDAIPGFRHRFTLRHPDIDVNEDREKVIDRLWNWHTAEVESMGFNRESLRTAGQVHGNHIAVLNSESDPVKTEACDGLVTNIPGMTLGIYVADCCAVYLVDPSNGACGIVHSGKMGTEGRITAKAVELLASRFASDPGKIIVQLSPCIRPPAYDVDFAAEIRQQALNSGVSPENLQDYLRLPNVPMAGGSWLAPADVLATGDWNAITQRARQACALAHNPACKQ